jgi:hypothetical protein
MLSALIVIFAQFHVTSADIYVKRKVSFFDLRLLKYWVPQYLLSRYTGLFLRLYALFLLPVASAAMLFSISAIGVSSIAAWRSGEKSSTTDKVAFFLVLIAFLIRGFKL